MKEEIIELLKKEAYSNLTNYKLKIDTALNKMMNGEITDSIKKDIESDLQAMTFYDSQIEMLKKYFPTHSSKQLLKG